jgi:integrase
LVWRSSRSSDSGWGHELGETKTRRGRRQVNLTLRTVKALRTHRKRQLEEKLRLVGLYEDSGLIFTTQTGTPVNPENLVKRSFKPLLREANLPDIRFHDLRHTCATLLLGRGVHPKLVQELLGHATIAMTLDTYSHYLRSMGRSGRKRDGRCARLTHADTASKQETPYVSDTARHSG